MANTFTGLKLQGQLGRFGRTALTDIEGYVELPDGKVRHTICLLTLKHTHILHTPETNAKYKSANLNRFVKKAPRSAHNPQKT